MARGLARQGHAAASVTGLQLMSAAVHLDAAWSEAGLDSRSHGDGEFRSIPRTRSEKADGQRAMRRGAEESAHEMQPATTAVLRRTVARSWSSCKDAAHKLGSDSRLEPCSVGEFRSIPRNDAGRAMRRIAGHARTRRGPRWERWAGLRSRQQSLAGQSHRRDAAAGAERRRAEARGHAAGSSYRRSAGAREQLLQVVAVQQQCRARIAAAHTSAGERHTRSAVAVCALWRTKARLSGEDVTGREKRYLRQRLAPCQRLARACFAWHSPFAR
jgi:hypothetical protein